jgi:branched-chain amino acid transport system permease protein
MHGSLLLLGAYTIAVLDTSIGFLPAVLVGIAATSGVGFLVERLLINRLRGARSSAWRSSPSASTS